MIENMPALTGSPKQIEWANRIRTKMWAEAIERMAVCSKAKPEAMRLVREQMWKMYQDNTRAEYWIDNHRDHKGSSYFQPAAELVLKTHPELLGR